MFHTPSDASRTHSVPLRWRPPANVGGLAKPPPASPALGSPKLVSAAFKSLANAPTPRTQVSQGERLTSSDAKAGAATPAAAKGDASRIASITRTAVRDGGWLHNHWKPSAAGVAATESSPRRASVKSLVGAFEQITNVGRGPSFRPSVKNHRAPPPPSLTKQQGTPRRADSARVPSPAPTAVPSPRPSPPPTPIKPPNLLAIFAARDEEAAKARLPAASAGPTVEHRHSDGAAVHATTAPAGIPTPPPMPMDPPRPPVRGSSLDSASPNPLPHASSLTRSQSDGELRANLFAELLQDKGVQRLKKHTVETNGVGKATGEASVARSPKPARYANVRVDLLAGMAEELRAKLKERGQSPVTHEESDTQKNLPLIARTPPDSGNGSASSSPPPTPTVSQLNSLTSGFGAGTAGGRAFIADLKNALQTLNQRKFEGDLAKGQSIGQGTRG